MIPPRNPPFPETKQMGTQMTQDNLSSFVLILGVYLKEQKARLETVTHLTTGYALSVAMKSEVGFRNERDA